MDLWDSLFRTLLALAIVLALMAAVAMAAKRFLGRQQRAGGRPSLVRVVASGYLGPRKTISLVSVAGDYLIVGATATDLVPLGRVSDSGKVEEWLASSASDPSPLPSVMPPSMFASWFHCLPDGMRHRNEEHHGER